LGLVKHVALATELRGSQQERRRRVLEAAMSLASEGGYEAVQMRDVAERAGVALGTVYRYFNSKDHLLAASLVYWSDQLAEVLTDAPARGDNAAERVANLLERAMRAVSGQPKLVAALLAAMSSLESGVTECRERAATTMDPRDDRQFTSCRRPRGRLPPAPLISETSEPPPMI
jgi:AcrR family transcriptional regulator